MHCGGSFVCVSRTIRTDLPANSFGSANLYECECRAGPEYAENTDGAAVGAYGTVDAPEHMINRLHNTG